MAALVERRAERPARAAIEEGEALGAELLNAHLAHALDALEQKPDQDARQAIARAFRRADARAAGVEAELLAYVRSTVEEPHLASTAFVDALLVETLFGDPEGAPRETSLAAQAWALEALASATNQQFAALTQWPRIVDKKAACDAVVRSLQTSGGWIDTMTTIMGRHDCDAHLVTIFQVLVEKVPHDSQSVLVTVLRDIDARVEVPAALRTLAATRLRERRELDGRTMRAGPLTQEWLDAFAGGAAYFAAPRPSKP